jgi:hypothetical protein
MRCLQEHFSLATSGRKFLWLCLTAALAGCDINSAAQHDQIDAADDAASGAAAKMSDPSRAATEAAFAAGAAVMKAMPEEEQLALAYKALFGNGSREILTSSGRELRYDDGKIIWLDDTAILVAPGSNGDSSPVTIGALGIFYLKPNGQEFMLLKKFPVAIDGSIMGNPPEWEISKEFGSFPVIVSKAGGVWQGYSCGATLLTELIPSGPSDLVGFDSHYSNGGARGDDDQDQTVDGEIVNIVKDKSFEVRFGGTQNFTHHYDRHGDSYTRPPGDTKEEIPKC